MRKNLELKVKINSLDAIIEKMNHPDIKETSLLDQKDIYYKVNEGILKLRIENGNNTLIFYKRNENEKERWSNYSLIKMDGDSIPEFLANFFEEIITVKKLRKLFMYKNTRIHLDEVALLGYFLELEAVVTENEEKSKNEFEEIIKILDLDITQEIKCSYKDLLAEIK